MANYVSRYTGSQIDTAIGKVINDDFSNYQKKQDYGLETTDKTIVGAINEVNTNTTTKYVKPSSGIPKSDLDTSIQTSLGKADTALQSAPVTSVNGKTGAVTLATSNITNDSGYITSNAITGKVDKTAFSLSGTTLTITI